MANGKGKGGKAGGKKPLAAALPASSAAVSATTPAAARKAKGGERDEQGIARAEAIVAAEVEAINAQGRLFQNAFGTQSPSRKVVHNAIASMKRYGDTQSRRATLFMAMAVVCALIAVVALGGVFLINGSHGRLQERLEQVQATARSLRSEKGCPRCPKCPSCPKQAAAVALAESKTKDGRECPAPEPSSCPSCPRRGDEGPSSDDSSSSSSKTAAATGAADSSGGSGSGSGRTAVDKEAARRVFRGMPLREIEMLGQTFMSSKVRVRVCLFVYWIRL